MIVGLVNLGILDLVKPILLILYLFVTIVLLSLGEGLTVA